MAVLVQVWALSVSSQINKVGQRRKSKIEKHGLLVSQGGCQQIPSSTKHRPWKVVDCIYMINYGGNTLVSYVTFMTIMSRIGL